MHVAHLSIARLLICRGFIDNVLSEVAADRCVTSNAVSTITFETRLGAKNVDVVEPSVHLGVAGVANVVPLASVPRSEVVVVSARRWIEGFAEQVVGDLRRRIVGDGVAAGLQPREHIGLCHNGSVVRDEAVVVGAVRVLASERLVVGAGHVCRWHRQELVERRVGSGNTLAHGCKRRILGILVA